MRFIADGRQGQHFGKAVPADNNLALAAAVGVSLLVHGMVLVGWTPAINPGKIGGGKVLTVTLGVSPSHGSADALWNTHQSPAPARPYDAAEDLVPFRPTTVKPQESEALTVQRNESMLSKSVRAEGSVGQPGMGGSPARSIQNGFSNAVLVIDPSGHVTQIIWQEIPPLTGTQFSELESRVRAKSYAPLGREYTVKESVAVWEQTTPIRQEVR